MPLKIPLGLATNVGLSAALGQVVAAGVLLVTDHSPEAVGAFVGAVLTLLTVLGGRYAQAAAYARSAANVAIVRDDLPERDDPPSYKPASHDRVERLERKVRALELSGMRERERRRLATTLTGGWSREVVPVPAVPELGLEPLDDGGDPVDDGRVSEARPPTDAEVPEDERRDIHEADDALTAAIEGRA